MKIEGGFISSLVQQAIPALSNAGRPRSRDDTHTDRDHCSSAKHEEISADYTDMIYRRKPRGLHLARKISGEYVGLLASPPRDSDQAIASHDRTDAARPSAG